METWNRRRGHGRAKLRELDHLFEVIEIEEIKLDTSCMFPRWRRRRGNIHEVEEIKLDTSEHEHEIVVLLRDPKRPECLFGWRMPAVDTCDFESGLLNDERNLKDAAEMHATIIQANLQEHILADGYGLPGDCFPNVINWF